MGVEPRTSDKNEGLLQVSDHPRIRHNSADNVDQDNNNYENFAHELSNSYMWPPMMTNTRDFSNSKRIDLNSTNRYKIKYFTKSLRLEKD